MFALLHRWWCRLFHEAVMHPGSRGWECRRCGERFPVPWSVA